MAITILNWSNDLDEQKGYPHLRKRSSDNDYDYDYDCSIF